MKRHLGLLSMIGVILFMAMTVFAGDVYVNGVNWGTYTDIKLDLSANKLEVIGAISPPTTSGNTINGKIANSTHFTTPTGSPISIGIPGVTVNLTGAETKSTTSDVNGNYEFKELVGGDYIVTPSKANYTFNPDHADVNVTSGGTATANFAAEALNDYTLGGTVFDKATPTPGLLTGVTVELRLGSTLVDSTSTGTDGTYTFLELLSGFTYRVTPVSSTKTFNPTFYDVLINSGNVTGKNFTEVAPPTTGEWTAAIKSAYKCNTALVGGIGGYGFYVENTPGPVSVKSNGKTYFLFDPVWLPLRYQSAGKLLTIMWINFNVTGKSQTTNLIQLDSADNGKIIGTKSTKQDSFVVPYKAGVRWLVEVDTTTSGDGFALSIKWP